jgi:hypothetical protein
MTPTTPAIKSVNTQRLQWPGINEPLRAGVIDTVGGGLVDLWEMSPVRIDDNEQHTEEIVDRLFPGNPLLCAGRNCYRFDTKPREGWRGGLAERQLIVPSPMSAIRGTTKTGERSKHTLENTGPRRFLVCEFDTGTTDDHAALLLHLAGYAPLVLAVHSGNRSLHGWFYVHGQPDAKLERFFRYAVSLGADPILWSRTQFARMPDGVRDSGKRQPVYFFNPAAVGKSA